MVKIDANDRKILHELNVNSRQSYNTIAKNTKLSKNQVVYRINRLQDEGVILRYKTTINHTKLGSHYYKYRFKLDHMCEQLKNQILDYVKDKENTHRVAFSEGAYNVTIEAVQTHVSLAIEYYLDFQKEFSSYISRKEFNIIAFVYNLPNNYLDDEMTYDMTMLRELTEKESVYALSADEKVILNEVKKDSRINVIEIAEKAGVSTKTIISKLKNLEKEGIIVQYRVSLDHQKFNLERYHISIKLNYKGRRKIESRICDFLAHEKSTIQITKTVGEYDLEFTGLFENTYQLIDLIHKMRKEFPDTIRSHESRLVTSVHETDNVNL